MQTICTKIPLSAEQPIIRDLFTEDAVFFDIETTGFSPRSTSLYLIGYAERNGDNARITQLLGDDPSEESVLLSAFSALLQSKRKMISFNGSGFDLPYLREKLLSYALPDPFSSLAELDIFREIRAFKKLLSLSDCKQKTVEAFLRIPREDTYSGGDLIPVYRHYAATRDELPRTLLLRHNYEDVLGMIQLLPVLSYPLFFGGSFSTSAVDSEGSRCTVHLLPQYHFPAAVDASQGNVSLSLKEGEALLRIPIFTGELKYFFPNPADYYYLPAEDTAIHKSVGEYVDKAYRKKATAKTAYTKKEGCFLPQPEEIFRPAFRPEYKSRLSWFPTEDLSPSAEKLNTYVSAWLREFL